MVGPPAPALDQPGGGVIPGAGAGGAGPAWWDPPVGRGVPIERCLELDEWALMLDL